MNEKEMANALAKIIVARRHRLKKTAAEVAESANISASTLSRYENGRVLPAYPSFIALCLALGLKPGNVLMKIADRNVGSSS